MTKQVTLENTLAGGFGLPTGQIVPGNGSILVEPEIWEASKDHPVVAARVKAGTIIVDGHGKKRAGADERDENGDTPEMAQLRTMFNASYERQGNALAAAQTDVTTLTGKVADLEAAVKAKDDQIVTLKAGNGGQGGATPALVAYTVTDKGSGWYAITQGGKEVTKSLRKDAVEGFDAFADADKAAFVDLHKPD